MAYPPLPARYGSLKRTQASSKYSNPEVGMKVGPGGFAHPSHVPQHVPGRLYDGADRHYRRPHQDPYDIQAQHARDIGRRFVQPYDAAAYLARQQALMASFPLPDMGPRNRVVVATGGQRESAQRTLGTNLVPPLNEIRRDVRQQIGSMETTNRDGSAVSLDYSEGHRRLSGKINSENGAQQHVYPDRPFLTLVAVHAPILVEVIAGLADGGAENKRQFILFGGWTAQFLMAAYDNVHIKVLGEGGSGMVPPTVGYLQFMWVSDGMQSEGNDLYLSQTVAPGDSGIVPDGAYKFIADVADAAWTWTVPSVGSGKGGTTFTGILGGQFPQVVGGTQWTASVANSIQWILRPI